MRLVWCLCTLVIAQAVWAVTPSKDEVNQMGKAIDDGDLQAIKQLIDRGFDIDYARFRWHQPLNTAIHRDKYEVVRFLLIEGANPNLGLVSACHRDGSRRKYIELLLQFGADINFQYDGGSTCLRNALSREPNLDHVRYLLSVGANVNTADNNGASPYSISIEREKTYRQINELFKQAGQVSKP